MSNWTGFQVELTPLQNMTIIRQKAHYLKSNIFRDVTHYCIHGDTSRKKIFFTHTRVEDHKIREINFLLTMTACHLALSVSLFCNQYRLTLPITVA
jgi:hypothetical protein